VGEEGGEGLQEGVHAEDGGLIVAGAGVLQQLWREAIDAGRFVVLELFKGGEDFVCGDVAIEGLKVETEKALVAFSMMSLSPGSVMVRAVRRGSQQETPFQIRQGVSRCLCCWAPPDVKLTEQNRRSRPCTVV
jgi:hypothetical protein